MLTLCLANILCMLITNQYSVERERGVIMVVSGCVINVNEHVYTYIVTASSKEVKASDITACTEVK